MISSPDHTRIFFSDRSVSFSAIIRFQRNISVCSPTYLFSVFILHRANDSDRHVEHMDNVRLYHQSLHEQTAPPSGSIIVGDVHPSSSFLISTLRYHSSHRCYNIAVFFKTFRNPSVFFQQEEIKRARQHPEIFQSKAFTSHFSILG